MRSERMKIETIPDDPQLTLDFSLAISIPELIDTLTYYMGVQQDKSPPTAGAGAVKGAPATASSGAHSPAVPVAVAGVRVRTPWGTQTAPCLAQHARRASRGGDPARDVALADQRPAAPPRGVRKEDEVE